MILLGHVIEKLKEIDDESVDCVVTSPPYYGLRKYGNEMPVWDGDEKCEHEWVEYTKKGISGGTKSEKVHIKGQDNFQIVPDSTGNYCRKCGAIRCELGQEPTVDLFIKHLADIFDEVKRVLKPTGTFWLNIGDTYSGSGGRGSQYTKDVPKYKQPKTDVPEKSLMGVPYRIALELIGRGWILRNDIIWHKPNPMPTSVKDRFTNTYEHIFFFVKERKYYFNQQFEDATEIVSSEIRFGGQKYPGSVENVTYSGNKYNYTGKRNMRDIVHYPTANSKLAHFAIFPKHIPMLAIDAGCPPDGVVLDPFMGSGTTAVVANNLGREWIGIELYEKNVKIIEQRLAEEAIVFDDDDVTEW